MSGQLTIDNVKVGDRIELTGKASWPHMIPPYQDFSLDAGAQGTVIEVDNGRGYIMVEWDDAPTLDDGTKQIVAHNYMPNIRPNGWNLKKVD